VRFTLVNIFLEKSEASMSTYFVDPTDLPAIAGLTLRGFQGEQDYPKMVAVLTASKEADHLEDVDTVETLTNQYAHLVNCDPYRDMLFVEIDGQTVGYARVYWAAAVDGNRIYEHVGFLQPQWRGRGIGRAQLQFCEQRLRAIAGEQATGQPRFFQAVAMGTQGAKIRLLERAGYTPARYFQEMVRPDLENLPEAPLPAGLEIRPVRPEHYRAIWDADAEAFCDHWGNVPHTDEDYQTWQGQAEFQPEVWKVAWDVATDQVAGIVQACILAEQNAKFQRRRGWTEGICVRRPWRRRGLARALIVESLRALKARGMTEAALGVDTENLSGALRLYEGLGFRAVQRNMVYRKPLAVEA
jgi:mycothiol synthase